MELAVAFFIFIIVYAIAKLVLQKIPSFTADSDLLALALGALVAIITYGKIQF